MEEKKWITTEQMLEALRNNPNNEQQYTHYLGGILRSTHGQESKGAHPEPTSQKSA
jgi:hypothetical protein